MSKCKDIDAQMIDRLYNELAPDENARFDQHVQGCTQCRNELASLSQVRTLFRDLPELEPPAAGAAILMHEAGKRAPARAAKAKNGDNIGVLAWLTGWLQPVLAHPALAAAASLVLVATVAGSMYLRGKPQYAKPMHTADTAATTDTIDTIGTTGTTGTTETPAAAPSIAAEPAEQAKQAEQAEEAGQAGEAEKATLARDGYRAEMVDETLSQDLAGAEAEPAAEPAADADEAVAVDTRKRELSLKELADSANKDAKPSRTQQGPRKRASGPTPSTSSTSSRSSKRSMSPMSPKTNAASSDMLAADKGFADAPEDWAQDDAEATGGSSAGVRLGSIQAETKAKKSAPRRASLPAAKNAANGRAAGSAMKPPPPVAKPAEAQAPAPSSEPTYQPSSEPTFRQSSASKRDTRAELAWAKSRHSSLLSAARTKRCGDAARIAVDILDRNPGYYHGNVEGSKEMKSCMQYVAAERRMRAKRRASSKADTSEAAEQAAPAQQAAPTKK